MLLNCSCTTSIDNSLFEFTTRPRRSKPDAHSHLLVWTYRERRVGLNATRAFLWVSQRQHHLTDLNSNNKKIIEWLPWSNRFEQRKQPSSGSQRLVGFSGGAQTRYKKYPCKGKRARENHMKPFVRTSFLGTRPSCLPSPERPLFDPDDRKPILWPGRTGSLVIKGTVSRYCACTKPWFSDVKSKDARWVREPWKIRLHRAWPSSILH